MYAQEGTRMPLEAVLERRIEECEKCLADHEGILGRLRTGQMPILSLPEGNDDQSAPADEYYEASAPRLRKHIEKLSRLLAKIKCDPDD